MAVRGRVRLLVAGFWPLIVVYAVADAHADLVADEPNETGRLYVNVDSGRSFARRPLASQRDIIIRFRDDVPHNRRTDLVSEYGCEIIRTNPAGRCHLVRIAPNQTPTILIDAFRLCSEVEYAEPDYYAYAAFVPDDEFFSFQWNLSNSVNGGVGMEAAWDLQQGDPNVVIAVLDTGVAYEDFGAFRQAPDLAGTPFVPGFDFINDDVHPNDDQGHGTHVAGTIAQSTDNELGVAGVAFGCSIMPVKVLDEEGAGSHFTIAKGIAFAVENGAHVINMSLGGPGDSRTLRDAITMAYERGVTVVCAAGNDFNNGNAPAFPAAYDDICIAVGAVRFDLTRARYSNTGAYVDVVAPGGDLLVDQNGDGFADGIVQQTFVDAVDDFAFWFFQGTSMAAPHVSGLAALLASRGVRQPDKIRQAIALTARDLGPTGWDPQYGWGLMDAEAALAHRVVGDFGRDNVVDNRDLAGFLGRWLERDVRGSTADLNGDFRVDLRDFALLASNWDR
jgi:serine protease